MKLKLATLLLLNFVVYAQPPVTPLSESYSGKEYKAISRLTHGAKIIGIGESVHGSEEFLKARSNLTKYLVKEEGFRIIFFEEPLIKAKAMNQFLQECREKQPSELILNKILKTFNNIHQNQRMKEMFKWLCSFNHQFPEDPVYFHGVDIWEREWVFSQYIRNLFGRIPNLNKDLVSEIERARKNCFLWSVNSEAEAWETTAWKYLREKYSIPIEEHRICLTCLKNIFFYMEDLEKRKDISHDILYELRVSINAAKSMELWSSLGYTGDNWSKANNFREATQAYIALETLNFYHHNKRAIFLSHTMHTAKNFSKLIQPISSPHSERLLGVAGAGESILSTLGPNQYKAIGIIGYNVESSRDGRINPDRRNLSLNHYLSKRGERFFFNPYKLRGKKFFVNGYYTDPFEYFDYYFFVKNSGPAKPLFTKAGCNDGFLSPRP